ncbi:MAG: Flp pilus assembly complex ATPase component TadA [Planctomycetes bacterium]|nr:Flp pilus assembly complex ATPase component TadA [Planctomycetota bacterium]
MEIWVYNQYADTREIIEVGDDEVTIGRDAGNSVCLLSPFVSRRHARIFRQDGHYFVESLGLNGVIVANMEVPANGSVRCEFGDELRIGGFSLYMMAAAGRAGRRHDRKVPVRKRVIALEQTLHAELLDRLNLRAAGGQFTRDDSEHVALIKHHLDEIVTDQLPQVDQEMREHLVGEFLWRQSFSEITRRCTGKIVYAYGFEDTDVLDSRFENGVSRIIDGIVGDMGLALRSDTLKDDVSTAEAQFAKMRQQICRRIEPELRLYMVRRMLHKEIEDVVLGYGPLQDLLDMPNVNEIMVVGKDHIYLEKDGVLQNSGRSFFSDEVVHNIIERIITPLGRRIDRSSPLVDARLPDGSRVNAIIAPLSISGPTLTIRKFAAVPFTIDDLIERQTLSVNTGAFLKGCILGRKNILISGGTSSGKTTTLNVLASFISNDERIITVEDSAELQLPQEHVVRLETRPANVEGRGTYSIRDLIRNALRMRPDRLIVGETRGPEALDMLQAMNTGHDGSLSTIHANSPAETMIRLETMVLMAVDMPVRAIREQIIAAIDLVVQIARTPDGKRRVTHISEIAGIDPESLQIITEDIFVLGDGAGCHGPGRLRHTGYMPRFIEELMDKGCIELGVLIG